MVRLQEGPIALGDLVRSVSSERDGAIGIFLGVVRNENAGRRVLALEYHAYRPMAEAEMARIERAAMERFHVSSVALVHRLGRLEVGEASVAVAVASPHRAEALDACRYVMDALKKTVPIWKKEFFEGGAAWIEGEGS